MKASRGSQDSTDVCQQGVRIGDLRQEAAVIHMAQPPIVGFAHDTRWARSWRGSEQQAAKYYY